MDLIDSLSGLLGEGISQTFVTATARYQLKPKKRVKALEICGNEAILNRLTNFLNNALEIPEIRDTELLAELTQYEAINGGEALLFMSALENPSPTLLTGDRRALSCLLHNKNKFPSIYDALENKVVTTESVLLLAIHMWGFAIVKQKLLSSPKLDGVLRLVVKPDMDNGSLTECLRSYSRDIQPFLAYRDIIF